jgi:hypothetical protein
VQLGYEIDFGAYMIAESLNPPGEPIDNMGVLIGIVVIGP